VQTEESVQKGAEECVRLTLDLERVFPSASIQMYSAMMLPFWSSLRYLLRVSVRETTRDVE
jgi:hypothetical protein